MHEGYLACGYTFLKLSDCEKESAVTATHSCLARVTCGVGRPDRQLPPPTSPRTHSAHRLTPHMSDSPPDRPPAASGSKAKHRVSLPQTPRFRSRSTCTLPRPPRRGPSRRGEADTDRKPRCTQPRTTTACNRCRTKRGRCDGELSLRAQGPKASPGCAVVSCWVAALLTLQSGTQARSPSAGRVRPRARFARCVVDQRRRQSPFDERS